ncbi:SMC-Scp complex subunit ScpB [Saccharospirillum mangrovi]|uniref:SMC-Scp complex subunit ScpB n=1 Tax=Saccharospirillum mangrovi TaxID=2161747 RepID=UPI000D34D404|nr:SMC-Scp complex subunit ScpB [Saccharospirillum mangrovi]
MTEPNNPDNDKPVADELDAETSADELNTQPESESASEAVPESDPAAHDDPDLGDAVADDEDVDPPAEEIGDPYGGHAPDDVKHILEGSLFAAGTALSVVQLGALFLEHERPHRRIIRSLMAELMAKYSGGGLELVEVASGWRFQTRSDLGVWISRLWEEKPQRYSRALLETMALIAYRQPITRGEIEDVRGVSVSSSIIKTLQEREWVRVVGHRDVPGRPAMYATTRQFLDHFGLTSLDQLPSLGEIRDLEDLAPELALNDDPDAAGTVDTQAEISFSSMVDRLREVERSGKTGNDYIDEKLDDELSQMDAVNDAIEQAFEAQRAGHQHPDLDLSDSDDDDSDATTKTEETDSENNEPAEPMSDAEHLRIIEEKLAQQQALLDARERDQQRPEEDDEY